MAKRLTDEQRSLARELGIPDDASPFDLQRAIVEARTRLIGDAEVMQLRRCMETIKNACERGTKPMPGETANDNAAPVAAGREAC